MITKFKHNKLYKVNMATNKLLKSYTHLTKIVCGINFIINTQK